MPDEERNIVAKEMDRTARLGAKTTDETIYMLATEIADYRKKIAELESRQRERDIIREETVIRISGRNVDNVTVYFQDDSGK